MNHEQTFWISRYRSLYEILSGIEKEMGEWAIHDGYPLPNDLDCFDLPADIVSFLKIFGVGSQIGVRGYVVLHVEFPNDFATSDVCDLCFLNTKDIDKFTHEKLFGDKEVPLKSVLFWGYNVETEAFAYDTRSSPFSVCANYLFHDEGYQTFDDVLCSHLKLHCHGNTQILNWLADI